MTPREPKQAPKDPNSTTNNRFPSSFGRLTIGESKCHRKASVIAQDKRYVETTPKSYLNLCNFLINSTTIPITFLSTDLNNRNE
jgi:hypothetical protein